MMSGIFVTGTDTDIGKTFVSSVLAEVLKTKDHFKYIKPIQTGMDSDTQTVANRCQLQSHQFEEPVYHFKEPASPHRSAAMEDSEISLSQVTEKLSTLKKNWVLAEGAGGVLVPLKGKTTVLDLIEQSGLSSVIVSSPRLGTINHTLLTYEALKNRGLSVLGVIISGDGDEGLEQVLEEQGVPVLFRCPQWSEMTQSWKEYCDSLRPHIVSMVESSTKTSSYNLRRRDQDVVWHPFTQHKYFEEFPVVKQAHGVHLDLDDGRRVIDAMSSWWVNLHGHSHPYITEAIARQSSRLEHVIFAGFTHEPAIELSERLIRLFADSGCAMEKVFFSDNGSSAVEVAMKMAFQYQQQKGNQKRTKFLALKGGYHGDTLGAMSLGGTDEFHHVFKPLMSPVTFLEPDDLEQLEAWGSEAEEYAACIVEPLIQGAGGMRRYSQEYLQRLSQKCREKGVLLIADEIFTGFYRTGKCFAFEHAKVSPDLVCLSKGLSGGFLPLAATVARPGLFETFLSDDLQRAFLHGHSFTANPLACAAANASLDLLLRPECQQQIHDISLWSEEFLRPFEALDNVRNIRNFGTLGAFDFGQRESYFQGKFSTEFYKHCLDKGVLCRPLGGAVYALPPYCITKSELEKVYQVIYQTIEQRMS